MLQYSPAVSRVFTWAVVVVLLGILAFLAAPVLITIILLPAVAVTVGGGPLVWFVALSFTGFLALPLLGAWLIFKPTISEWRRAR